MSSQSPVLIGGSHNLAPMSPAWVACQNFVQAVIFETPRAVHVGCATGADQAAVLALGGGSCQAFVFAAFAAGGAGAWSGSAVSTVQHFAQLGGSVSWLAGGGLAVPLVARLMSRSLFALAGCSSAFFFQPGPGSLKVAHAALRSSKFVFVSRVGLAAAPVLPVASQPVSVLGFPFWLFAPAVQAVLF